MKTLLLVFIIIYLPITLLMYVINFGDMIDARRYWRECRRRFNSVTTGPEATESAIELIKAVDLYNDTLNAMRTIWAWPWILVSVRLGRDWGARDA